MRQMLFAVSLVVAVMFHTEAEALTIESATGVSAADITAARDAFRSDLGGGTVAGANGSFGGVRREINWDGVPDIFAAPNNLPADFFNVNSPRGAVFSSPGSGFEVSANAGGVAPVEFSNIDGSYSSIFATFSPQRLFTALDSNVVDVNFFVAGTTIPAAVRGFGSVFTDVDLANTTSIEYFAPSGASLGTFFVPATAGSETLSFLGVLFDANNLVARVRITNGNAALGAGVLDENGVNRDLVVMDDFLFSEPGAIPEPGTLGLIATGLVVGLTARWMRRLRKD